MTMFKKTDPNPQLDIFTAPSMQLGSRADVYARRGKNGGYFPQCANRWNDRLCPKQRKEKVFCDECENTKWISLDVKK